MHHEPGTSRRIFLTCTAAAVAGAVAGPVMASKAATPSGRTTPRTPPADLALTHATIIDTRTGRRRPEHTVLVRGDRIVAVDRTAELPADAARIVDVRGKYVVPGLTDMHVHTSYAEIDMPLSIANGVTAVREMWGHPWVHEWKRDVEAGRRLGPRYTVGSQNFDGVPTLWNNPQARPSAPLTPRSPAEARRLVRAEVASGAEFVKVYSRLAPQVLSAIAAECAELGVRFGGHCPDKVTIQQAALLGQWTFEHLDGLWWSTSRRAAALHRRVDAIRVGSTDSADAYDRWFAQIGELEWTAARSYDRARAARVFDVLRGSGSWQTPTLTLNHRIDVPDGSADPRMKYVPDGDAAFWKMFAGALQATRTPAQVRQHEILFDRRRHLVADLAAHGVPLLAGTDVGTTYQFAGSSLLDELVLLAGSDVPALTVLQAATLEPARALGLARERGEVRRGAVADLVVLDADPLRDMANIRTIDSVVTRGCLYDRTARRGLLADAERAARSGTVQVAPVTGCGCAGHARPVDFPDRVRVQ